MEKLSATLQCVRWDRLKPYQRKDLALILVMSQNIRAYHGVFKPVSFETFQAVRPSIILYFLFQYIFVNQILEFNHSVTAILCATGEAHEN